MSEYSLCTRLLCCCMPACCQPEGLRKEFEEADRRQVEMAQWEPVRVALNTIAQEHGGRAEGIVQNGHERWKCTYVIGRAPNGQLAEQFNTQTATHLDVYSMASAQIFNRSVPSIGSADLAEKLKKQVGLAERLRNDDLRYKQNRERELQAIIDQMPGTDKDGAQARDNGLSDCWCQGDNG